ncbi:MAG: ATP-binding cassette domain-containing protein [Corallococcus sp.]|nr:ATP-binding cassette domain-containing protein [Corallococcus sp.]MCM1359309.1 ATP-binding cassette domain-containing protein [Corallococcus sp.]MCM1394880.1 ATP-binding cassette domain-containing protein [Corallococcus sp.]
MRIEFDNVTLRYHYDDYDVLCGASFTLSDDVNTILCDVQSGKGTICKLILGNLVPTQGRVLLDGRETRNLSKQSINALYLSLEPAFFENKTVLYNLQYPLRVRKSLKENAKTVLHLAEEFGLADFLGKKVKSLSFEQKLKLSLARGLTVKRDLVLLDGFFDDNNLERNYPELSLINVLPKFEGTVAVLSVRPEIAVGRTVVMDGGACVYEGDADGARQKVTNLGWLASKI